ncbi:hypothetical protein VTO42DRAFT_6769 [Malbranchea cinnamomea]
MTLFRPLRRPIQHTTYTRLTVKLQQARFLPINNPSPSSQSNRVRTRLQSLNSRLPRSLQKYTTPLLGAPLTHITSFLILHEITAIVPLFALVGAFHYGGWLPSFVTADQDGSGRSSTRAFDEGVRKFGKWLLKRGWVDEKQQLAAINEEAEGITRADQNPNRGVRLILEFAAAYAVTKALLPVRIAVSVWATPWFARTILVPASGVMRRFFRRF